MSKDMEDREETPAEEIARYEKDVNTALRRFYTRTKWEQTTERTPLDDLLASEDGMLDEWAVKRETALGILLWIAEDGPHPGDLLNRLYLMGAHMMIEPYCLLTLRERGKLTNTSHGKPHWLLRRAIIDPLMRRGAQSVKAPGQKGSRAAVAATLAQKGNKNRAKKRAEEPSDTGVASARKTHRRPKNQPKKQP